MIKKISIHNFKSYESADLHLAPLSVLIGANASGKSNMLEALRLISWLAQGQKLSALQYQVNKEDQIVRGFISHLPRFGQQKFSLGCSLAEGAKTLDFNATIGLRSIRNTEELHLEEESCNYKDWLYRTNRASEDHFTNMVVKFNNFKKGGNKPQFHTNDQQLVFSQITPASFEKQYKAQGRTILHASELLKETLSKIVFLDPNPKLMHDYSFKADKVLQESGRNISAVLHHLTKGQEKPETNETNRKKVLEFIKSLPEQNISGLSFIETPRGEVLLQLHEAVPNQPEETEPHKVDASLLSDGTLRALAIVALLLSAEAGSLVIIEEIDNGIHPGRVKDLMQRINTLAEERQLSVLITSHNATLLNAIPKNRVADVQFCYRDAENGSSKISRIKDIRDYPSLIAQDDLGNLLTRGLIDQYAKDETSAEEKIKKGLDWLNQFMDE